MGKSESKPYVVDDFDSNDDIDDHDNPIDVWRGYALALKDVPDVSQPGKHFKKKEKEGAVKKQTQQRSSQDTKKGLKKLVKFLDNKEFEAAKKAANLLIENQVLSVTTTSITDKGEVILIESTKSLSSSETTSSWSSKSPQFFTVTSDYTISQLAAEEKASTTTELQGTVDCLINDLRNKEKIVNEQLLSDSSIPQVASLVMSSQNELHKQQSVSRTQQVSLQQSSSACFKAPDTTRPFRMTSLTGRLIDTERQKHYNDNFQEPHLNMSAQTRTDPNPGNSKKSLSVLTCSCKKKTCKGTRKCENTALGIPSGRTTQRNSSRGFNLTIKNRCHPSRSLKKTDLDISILSKSSEARNIFAASQSLYERKVLDLKRWYCIARPQYRTSSGVSSLVSCWNFLFSTLGYGSLKPVTQDVALMLLGFHAPFDDINFGTMADNVALFRWFFQLNSHFGVSGRCSFLYKPLGKNRTKDMTSDMAVSMLKDGLKDGETAFIYHCYKHYFCPIGYDDTFRPREHSPISNVGDTVGSNAEDKNQTWLLIGDTDSKFPSIHCASWKEICLDLDCKSPNYFDIRHNWRGVRQTENKSDDQDNCHCILIFQKVTKTVAVSSSTVCSLTMRSSVPASLPRQHQDSSPSFLPHSSQTNKSFSSLDNLRPELKIITVPSLPRQHQDSSPSSLQTYSSKALKSFSSFENLRPELKNITVPSSQTRQLQDSSPSSLQPHSSKTLKCNPSFENLKPELKNITVPSSQQQQLQDSSTSSLQPHSSKTFKCNPSFDNHWPELKNVTNVTITKANKVQHLSKSPLRGGSITQSSPFRFSLTRSASPPNDKSELRFKPKSKEYYKQQSPCSKRSR